MALVSKVGGAAGPLGGDRLRVRARLAPDWWMARRVPLSGLLAAEALASAIAA